MSFEASPVRPGDHLAPISSVAGESMAESRVSIAEWEVLNLQRLFAVFDPQKTGYLLFDEVLDLLRATGITGMTLNQLRKYDHILDPLAQGVVEFPDLVEFYIHEHRELSRYRQLSHADEKDHVNNYLTLRFIANSKRRICWDFVILVISLYYAVRVNYEWYRCTPLGSGSLVAEIILSVILLLDILVQANTMYYDEHGRLVDDLETIVRSYATSWMIPDLLGAIPLDLILLGINPDDPCAVGGYLVVRTFRIMRLIRVFVSIFENSDVPGGLSTPSYIYFVYRVSPAIKAAVFLILFFHVLTVGWLQVSDDGRANPISTNEPDQNRTVTYVDALYYTIYTLSTIGYGDIKVETSSQRIYTIFLDLCAVMFNGLVISQISAFLTEADIDKFRKQRMSETLAVLKYFNVNKTLQSEILSFQSYLLEHNLSSQHRELYSGLPAPMQEKVVLAMRLKLINLVPVFNDCLPDVKLALANSLVNSVFCPQQFIIVAGEVGTQMFFLGHGVADVIAPDGKFLATLRKGMFFGEMAIFVESALRTASIKALTYCDVFSLRREDFVSLLSKFRSLRESIEGQMKERIRDYRTKSSVTVIVKPRSERPGGKKKVVLKSRNALSPSLAYGSKVPANNRGEFNNNTLNFTFDNINSNSNVLTPSVNVIPIHSLPNGGDVDDDEDDEDDEEEEDELEMLEKTSQGAGGGGRSGGGGGLPTDADIENFNKTHDRSNSMIDRMRREERDKRNREQQLQQLQQQQQRQEKEPAPASSSVVNVENINNEYDDDDDEEEEDDDDDDEEQQEDEEGDDDEDDDDDEEQDMSTATLDATHHLATTQASWKLQQQQQQKEQKPRGAGKCNNVSSSPALSPGRNRQLVLPRALTASSLSSVSNSPHGVAAPPFVAAANSNGGSVKGSENNLTNGAGLAGASREGLSSQTTNAVLRAAAGSTGRIREKTTTTTTTKLSDDTGASVRSDQGDDLSLFVKSPLFPARIALSASGSVAPSGAASPGAQATTTMRTKTTTSHNKKKTAANPVNITSPADFGYSGSHVFSRSNNFVNFDLSAVGTAGLDALSSYHQRQQQRQQQQQQPLGHVSTAPSLQPTGNPTSTIMNIADAVRLLRAQKLQKLQQQQHQRDDEARRIALLEVNTQGQQLPRSPSSPTTRGDGSSLHRDTSDSLLHREPIDVVNGNDEAEAPSSHHNKRTPTNEPN